MTHGRVEEAEKTIADVEKHVEESGGGVLPPAEGRLTVHPRKSFGFGLVFGTMFGRYKGRSFLAFMLMVAQAFLFNAVFFTYGWC